MRLLRPVTSRLRRLWRDTGGTVSVEFVLTMPFVFWSFMAAYVYYDGYRQSALNLKAAYTISDLISRETMAINNNYIDSMQNLLNMLTNTYDAPTLRVTVIRWSARDKRYYVDWSANRGFSNDLTDENVSDMEHRLPVMPNNERVILVETSSVFSPMFNIGMGDKTLTNFVFTRPRFAPQVAWSNS